MVKNAAMGSTAPDSTPATKARDLRMPSEQSGMDTIAPSGKFCIAMPTDSANALAAVIPLAPLSNAAYTMPTAMPSGMLCMVTASTVIVTRDSLVLGPSAETLLLCMCGVTWSSNRKNSTPSHSPTNAGTNAQSPIADDCAMAGISKLHTDAATITPAANPVSARCTPTASVLRIKNTHAAPTAVPTNGISIPSNVSTSAPLHCILRCNRRCVCMTDGQRGTPIYTLYHATAKIRKKLPQFMQNWVLKTSQMYCII